MAPLSQAVLSQRQHSHHAIRLNDTDILRVQNQVLEAKVLQLTEELVTTQYELRIERVNYKYLHRKTLGLEDQLECQVHLVMDLEERLADTAAELESYRESERVLQPPTIDLTAMYTEHLTMLHEDLNMYSARCALYEASIRELWTTYVTPWTVKLSTADFTDTKRLKLSTVDKDCEGSDADSDDTASMDSDSYDRELHASNEVLEMASHCVDELCVALADSIVLHQQELAALSTLETQFEVERLQYEELLMESATDEEASQGQLDIEVEYFADNMIEIKR
ncbi:hypothetical protein H310_04302 [Aphanomyces invadans]|uniref:Uncharacterized protein n=1 Tax=Aphanomyces invadans TaxID=157072 RepID=A0A024UG89_9STRA|nr:hypothetical protein H310_04302 [Aphanomyces invadans]ETW05386.1 hypothetical protein H310_04302 [Aphanomyces invadans]|eukprot:XP_008866824.1 hypothetical protein H310_04302 [Aphanomyces invadans]